MQTLPSLHLPPALLQYASYHRDERNILLHAICMPFTLFAIILLFNAALPTEALWLYLAGWVAVFTLLFFYIRLAGFLGLLTGTLISILYLITPFFSPGLALSSGIALLAISYFAHRLAHWYEGNYKQLSIQFSYFFYAPLFATAYLFKRAKPCQRFCDALDMQVGPTYMRDMVMGKHPATGKVYKRHI